MALKRGNRVILVSGPTSLRPPDGARNIRVSTAIEMKEQVIKHIKEANVFISSAAVTDYRPLNTCRSKIKSGKKEFTINLTKNPDILKESGMNKGSKILVGFALETNNMLVNAFKKLATKNLDMIVANSPASLEGDRTSATLVFGKDKTLKLPEMDKGSLAEIILDEIEKL